MDALIASKIAIMIQEGILKGEIAKDSPTKLIAKGMEIMETFPKMSGQQKKEMLFRIIEKLAAGADGIVGTEDDIIPASTVAALKMILEQNILEDIVQVITSAAKGEFDINLIKKTAQEVVTVVVVSECMPLFKTLLEKIKKFFKKAPK